MGRRPIGSAAMTGAERVRRYRLKHAAGKLAPEPPVTKPSDPVTERPAPGGSAQSAELALALLARIIALEAELKLTRNELQHIRQWYIKTDLPDKGGMSFATYSAIVKALQPDSTPSDKDRADAIRAFNAWIEDHKTGRRESR